MLYLKIKGIISSTIPFLTKLEKDLIDLATHGGLQIVFKKSYEILQLEHVFVEHNYPNNQADKFG